MTTPLPDNVSATLRSDPTAALGALMVIASAHAELFSWAARMVCDASSEPQPKPSEPHGVKAPAVRKPKSNATAAYLALRREARDRDDENLRQAMRDSPASSIGDWAETIGKSRTSTVAALHRLRDAGLADSVEGKWTLVEETARAWRLASGRGACRRPPTPHVWTSKPSSLIASRPGLGVCPRIDHSRRGGRRRRRRRPRSSGGAQADRPLGDLWPRPAESRRLDSIAAAATVRVKLVKADANESATSSRRRSASPG